MLSPSFSMKQNVAFQRARLKHIIREPEGYLDLLVDAPDIARAALPGQFVMVRGWPGEDPLLARPFDIVQADAEAGTVRLIVKVEGRGTALIAALRRGNALVLTGPLGQPVKDWGCASICLLARGAGAAAVVLLAEEARRRDLRVHTILSASTASRLIGVKYLDPVSTTLRVATDDGSAGFKGSATTLVEELLQGEKVERIYTCGARRFARYVKELDSAGRVSGFVFLETMMACGMGDCHGCAVKKEGEEGYYLACNDGPLFPVSKVVLE